jgi:hypothetical protein
MTEIQDRISIQVGLSGYSFKIESANGTESSGWLGAESIFTVSQMQKRYSDVLISVFTPYCALVPENFHKPELSREMLSEVAELPQGAAVDYVKVPEYNAVMLFSNSVGGTLHRVVSESVLRTDGTKALPLPELYSMLKSLNGIQDYNSIVASYMDDVLYLVISQGKTLLLCNTYSAPDFTTAQYYIFLAMKKLQLNPEMSTINFRTPLTDEQEMSLYRYFKSVDTI